MFRLLISPAAIAWMFQLLGCGVPLPPPSIDQVVPGRGWNGEDTVVAIDGEGFLPQITFDASSKGQADFDRDFSAILRDEQGGEHPLAGVSAETYERLTGVVGAGLIPGLYDLEVISPSGTRASLPDAFTVSATRADRVDLDTSQVTYEVGELVTIEVALLDPAGQRVLSDAMVELRVSSPDGQVAVDWGSSAFEDQTVSTDTEAIEGRLGEDGYALVSLYLYTPQTVTFTLTPLGTEGLTGDELKVAIISGGDLTVDITLPASPFEVVAGTPFDVILSLHDLLGNPVKDRVVAVLLEDTCGSFAEVVDLAGTTVVSVTATAATDPDSLLCSANTLVAGALGESEPFSVIAGPAARFRVEPIPLLLSAGDDVLLAITPEDSWGNPTPWVGALIWDDGETSGPLDDCQVGAIVHSCALLRTRATPSDVIRVTGDDGTTGISIPFVVQPDDTVGSLELALPAVGEAGVPVRASLFALDAWGNLIDPSSIPLAISSWDDGTDPLACTFVAFEQDLSSSWDCTFFVAGLLDVNVTGPDGSRATVSLEVINGPVASVVLDAPLVVTAGEAFVVSGTAADAWGNPILVAPDPVLSLEDDSFSLTPSSAELDAAGAFAVVATVARAGTTRITALQGGLVLGISDPVTVLAGPVIRLGLTPSVPWVWVGDVTEVMIEALDLYDNRANWDGQVDVVGAGVNAIGLPVVAGLGSVDLTWTFAVTSEVLSATSSDLTLTGESPAFHVAVDCAVDPTAVLLFDGVPVGRACYDPIARSAFLTGSFVGSLDAGSPLVAYALAVGTEVVTGSDVAPAIAVSSIGRFESGGLVVQADGCGAEIWTSVWVGPDDGSAVGPIDLVPAISPIDVLVGSTNVDVVGVRDCSGDVASFAPLYLRTDLGTLTGPTPTGTGLELVLDASANGTAVLSMATADSGGEARVTAWVESGAAAGEAFVTVEGDTRRPVVWSQEPEGEALFEVGEIALRFSEPLRPETVTPVSVTVLGPLGPEGVSVALTDGDATLRITPLTPIAADTGIWEVTVSTDVRDTAGNRLDGTFTGGATPWIAQFGTLGALVEPVVCSVSGDVLRPDGDDGTGAEADSLAITADSIAQPDAWEVSVETAGVDVTVWRTPALAAVETLTWDARDATGHIVPNGVYDIEVTPLDGVGNRGGSCRVTTTVDNSEGAP